MLFAVGKRMILIQQVEKNCRSVVEGGIKRLIVEGLAGCF